MLIAGLVAPALAGCGDDADGASAQRPAVPFSAAVRITHDRDGRGPAEPRRTTLRCPSKERAAACRRLRALPRTAFRPVPPGTACTEIYGGPQTGRISGSVAARRVDARYERANGCEIARYERVAPLLRLAR